MKCRNRFKMNAILIEITSKVRNGSSGAIRQVQKSLAGAGDPSILCREVAPLYRLEGRFSEEDVRRICGELLCDPVAEQFSINPAPSDNETLFADVWYKPGVT